MTRSFRGLAAAAPLFGAALALAAGPVLNPDRFKPWVDGFNADDTELYPGAIPNAQAWAFLRQNVPDFECPDRRFEELYYFRWWTYRKHIKATPDGFVITDCIQAWILARSRGGDDMAINLSPGPDRPLCFWRPSNLRTCRESGIP